MRGEDVTITDVTIKTPDRKWEWGCEWHHSRKRWAEDFWIWKKAVSWDSTLEEGGRFVIWVRPDQLGVYRMPACWLSQWVESWQWMNSQHSKKLCLSLLMSENLKLKKVNKSFVPEPRKSSVFCVFQIPMRMNTYEHSMNICTFHISISWLCYKVKRMFLFLLKTGVTFSCSSNLVNILLHLRRQPEKTSGNLLLTPFLKCLSHW